MATVPFSGTRVALELILFVSVWGVFSVMIKVEGSSVDCLAITTSEVDHVTLSERRVGDPV